MASDPERRLSVLLNAHPGGHAKAPGPSWLRGMQGELAAECEQVAQAVVHVRDKLTEIERFAADDWQTTEAEFEKLAVRMESRKVGGGGSVPRCYFFSRNQAPPPSSSVLRVLPSNDLRRTRAN